MTRHDYMAIAGVIRHLASHRLLVAERFAAMFANHDPRFDRTQFLADRSVRH